MTSWTGKITTTDEEGHKQTKRVRVLWETDRMLYADILDTDWLIAGRFDKGGVHIQQAWLVDKSLITKRVEYTQNLKYATWEPVRRRTTS
jgi:hypothetical protein